MNSTLFDQFFRDGTGDIIIGQPPNLPIVIWGVASLLRLIFKTGQIDFGLNLLATGALLVWAILELFQGVNYFRRALGAIVLIGLLVSQIKLLTANS
jgi:hypothetical protein